MQTWELDLARHVHLHSLVGGGVLASSGEWISPKDFLFPVRALSHVFRGKFVAGLEALRSTDRTLG